MGSIVCLKMHTVNSNGHLKTYMKNLSLLLNYLHKYYQLFCMCKQKPSSWSAKGKLVNVQIISEL